MTTPAIWLDYGGVALFAATGAFAAAEQREDVLTFFFFAVFTGVGGGTLRDLLIGVPVFWVHDTGYVLVCAAAALLVWWLRSPRPAGWLEWLDALGLAVYAVLGTGKAMAQGVPAPVSVVMGALTAGFGGILRDVVAGQPSILLRREIYISAALLASSVYAALSAAGLGHMLALGGGFGAGFGLRAGALVFGWSLPPFRPAAGRE